MRILLYLLITTLLISLPAQSKNFCFIQLLSGTNEKEIENIFNQIREYPSTFLLKYNKFYTIRVGPFKSIKICRFRRNYLEEKYRNLHLKPIILIRTYKIPPSNHLVKIFNPTNQRRNTSVHKRFTEHKKQKEYLLYLQKAKICMGKKDCTNAIKYLSLAIAKNPHNPLLYTYLGYAYSHIGNYTKALESFKKALEINPKFAEGYAGMGYLYLQLHAPNAAALAFKKAHELNPKDIVYSVNYAISLLEAKKYKNALKVFKELKEKYPFLPEIYFNEAILLIKTGNYTEAKNDLKLFLEMTKANQYYTPYRETAQKLIQAINSITKGNNEKGKNTK